MKSIAYLNEKFGEKLLNFLQVLIIQEQLSLKETYFYFQAFCLNLLDFKKQNTPQFAHSVFVFDKIRYFCRKKKAT